MQGGFQDGDVLRVGFDGLSLTVEEGEGRFAHVSVLVKFRLAWEHFG